MLKRCLSIFKAVQCNGNGEVGFLRQIPTRSIVTVVPVSPYLLDRSTPPSQILESLTPEDAFTLQEIKREYETGLARGKAMPRSLKDIDYVELLCLSRNQRRKHYKYLMLKEFTKENEDEKRRKRVEERKKMMSEILGEQQEDQQQYCANRINSKYHNKHVKVLTQNRLVQSIVLGAQPIVFDLSFEDTMSRAEVRNLTEQIQMSYAINRKLAEPFQISFVNLRPGSVTENDLKNQLLNGYAEGCNIHNLEDLPILIDERHYLDVYKDRRLIYLTPDSNRFFDVGEYDHDAVHIIGGVVDKSHQKPLCIARARKERIEHRAFPIDRYVSWKNGFRGLTINQAFNVMAIARETNGNWERAIKESIPPRALYTNSSTKNRKKQFTFE